MALMYWLSVLGLKPWMAILAIAFAWLLFCMAMASLLSGPRLCRMAILSWMHC